MPEQPTRKRRELEAELARRAWADEAFRRGLVEDPRGTLERELGVRLPEGLALTVIEESPTSRYLVLPPRPPAVGRELSDAELDRAVGAGTDYSWCTSLDENCQYCN